ncbi:unnamed protein product [Malus baccata var. baccata]
MGVHAGAFNHKALFLYYSGDLESGFNNLGLYFSNSKGTNLLGFDPKGFWLESVQDLDAEDEMSSMAEMVAAK